METTLNVLSTIFLFLGAYFLLLILVILTKYTNKWPVVKKILKISGIVAIIGLIIGAATFATLKGVKEEEKSYWKDITLTEYYELNEGTQPSLIYIGRPTCSHCTAFSPKLKAASIEKKVLVNYFNLDQITDEATFTEFKKSNSVLSTDGWGTPLVLLVKNKTVIDAISGNVESSEITAFFEKNNLGE